MKTKRISDTGYTLFFLGMAAALLALLFLHGAKDTSNPDHLARWEGSYQVCRNIAAALVGQACLCWLVSWRLSVAGVRRQTEDNALEKQVRSEVLHEVATTLLDEDQKKAKLFRDLGLDQCGQPISRPTV